MEQLKLFSRKIDSRSTVRDIVFNHKSYVQNLGLKENQSNSEIVAIERNKLQTTFTFVAVKRTPTRMVF